MTTRYEELIKFHEHLSAQYVGVWATEKFHQRALALIEEMRAALETIENVEDEYGATIASAAVKRLNESL